MEDQVKSMEKRLQQLLDNQIDVNQGVRSDVADLRKRFDKLKMDSDERDRMLQLALKRADQPGLGKPSKC